MARLTNLDPATLTPEQKHVYDEVAASHQGQVRGPWAILLRDPDVLHNAHELYERLCVNTKLGERLFELMVIVIARQWTSQFEWYAHERKALEVGVSKDVVGAIRRREVPKFEHDDEKLVYDTVTELSTSRTLSQPAYDRALAFFGENKLVELISGAGVYTMIAMVLNSFDAPIPPGAEPLV